MNEDPPLENHEPPAPEPAADPAPPRPPRQLTSSRVFRVAVICEAALVILAIALGWLLGPDPLRTHATAAGLPAALGWGLAATLPMLAGLFILERVRFGEFAKLHDTIDDYLLPLFRPMRLWQLGLISLLAGLGEELLFRGWLQAGIAGWIGGPAGPWIGLVLASLVFGVCYAVTRLYALLATLAGIYLGLVFLLTDHLLPAILAHALYDFAALVYMTRFAERKV